MANEKRLIDANALAGKLYTSTFYVTGMRNGKTLVKEWLEKYRDEVLRMICKQPVVDAVVLPCKIGDDVYIIPSKVNFDLNVLANHKENNRVHHQKVAEIVFNLNGWYMRGTLDTEYGTDRILVDRFYNETWFLTKEEAEAALAKMDGDGNE